MWPMVAIRQPCTDYSTHTASTVTSACQRMPWTDSGRSDAEALGSTTDTHSQKCSATPVMLEILLGGVPGDVHSTHRCTSLAASLSSRKMLSTRDLAMSPSPISFHSHDSNSRRRFSTRSGLLLTPTSLFLEGGPSLAILLFPSSSFNCTHSADDAPQKPHDGLHFCRDYC